MRLKKDNKKNQAFVKGNITEISNGKVKYTSDSSGSNLCETDITNVFKVGKELTTTEENLAKLKIVNDAEIVRNLEKRFKENQIYTYCKKHLIVVNPNTGRLNKPTMNIKNQLQLYQ